MPRFRITSLIVLVALVAGGLGAMRIGTEVLARSFTTLSMVAMLVGLTGALVIRKAAWIGFAVFMVGYARAAPVGPRDGNLGNFAIKNMAEALHPSRTTRPVRPNVDPLFVPLTGSSLERHFLEEDLDNSAMLSISSKSVAEKLTIKDYQKQLRFYLDEDDLAKPRQQHSITIGNACIALILGWVGAIVGRSLEKRQFASSASRSVDPQSTTTL